MPEQQAAAPAPSPHILSCRPWRSVPPMLPPPTEAAGEGIIHGGGSVDDEVLAVADGADGAAVGEHDRLGGREGHPGGKRESVHLGDGAAPRSAVWPRWEGPGGIGGRGRRGSRQAPSNKRGPAR